ncbi:MAG: hypothetical protein AAGF92_24850 [Myxococcota bacterium]
MVTPTNGTTRGLPQPGEPGERVDHAALATDAPELLHARPLLGGVSRRVLLRAPDQGSTHQALELI